jgi:hypothetical protein
MVVAPEEGLPAKGWARAETGTANSAMRKHAATAGHASKSQMFIPPPDL